VNEQAVRCVVALVAEEDRPRVTGTGCDVILSDDDVTRVESCLNDIGRSFVGDYAKSQRRRHKDTFDLCGCTSCSLTASL